MNITHCRLMPTGAITQHDRGGELGAHRPGGGWKCCQICSERNGARYAAIERSLLTSVEYSDDMTHNAGLEPTMLLTGRLGQLVQGMSPLDIRVFRKIHA